MLVLTHNAPEDEEDASIRFLSGDIAKAVDVARESGGGKNVMVIGADVARQCLKEIRVYLVPVLLRDGGRFFSWPGAREALRLETMGVVRSGQVTDLRFRVVGSRRERRVGRDDRETKE